MKKQQSNFEYRLAEATTFEDGRGRPIILAPNTRLIYGGYSDEGLGQFTVAAGKENGRRVQVAELAPEAFRGGASRDCRVCGAVLDADHPRSIMVPDLCSACEDAGEF